MNRDASIRKILDRSFPQVSSDHQRRLVEYYELVIKWNKRISLTTISSPREFAERHVGESVFAASCLLVSIQEFWDIGTGLGIPGIPVAILRPDIDVKLVESNRKKAIFLEEAVGSLGLSRVEVLNVRFETLGAFSDRACIAARAVERMSQVVRLVIEKAGAAGQVLVFGGADLEVACPVGKTLTAHLLPGSTGRYLFEIS